MAAGMAVGALMALSLGFRHGLDADHLAVVDALSRQRSHDRSRGGRWTGVLFASGHLVVVLGVALVLACTSIATEAPEWLGDSGAVFSSATLLVLGALNVRSATRRNGDGGKLVGLRSRWTRNGCVPCPAWHVIALGALFAVSFDSIAIAILLARDAVSSARVGVAASFALGMLAVSAINGLWVGKILQALPRHHTGPARAIALAVGTASLGVALWMIAPIDIDEQAMSLFVIGLLVVGYAMALVLARCPPRLATRGIGGDAIRG